jgi:hypothetical protein
MRDPFSAERGGVGDQVVLSQNIYLTKARIFYMRRRMKNRGVFFLAQRSFPEGSHANFKKTLRIFG